MSRPILLFAPETFNIAETTRMIEVAKACQEEFEPHFLGYGGQFMSLVQEAGFVFHHLQPYYTAEKINYLWKIDRMESAGEPFTVDEISERVQSELDLFASLKPVAIVIGFTLTIYVSARIAKIPLIAITPFSFTRPFFEAKLATFPDQFRVSFLKYVPKSWLNWAMTVWSLRTKAWTKNFNYVLKRYGHKPFNNLMALWEADYMLIAETPDITGVTQLPPNWHYVGPIFAHLDTKIPPETQAWIENHAQKKLIYCAMGSSGNQNIVQQVIQAFGKTDYSVIAPVQAHGITQVPANVLVTGWLPAPYVNGLADLAVIHGGHGTVQTACASGTPFVGIGMQPEQEWNIDFIVRKGSAIRLSRREVTPNQLINAIDYLAHNQMAHDVAKQIQSEYSKWDGAKLSAEFIISHFK